MPTFSEAFEQIAGLIARANATSTAFRLDAIVNQYSTGKRAIEYRFDVCDSDLWRLLGRKYSLSSPSLDSLVATIRAALEPDKSPLESIDPHNIPQPTEAGA